MNSSRFPGPLSGIVPPLVTPLTAPDSLHYQGVSNLVEHVIAGGVAGVFLLGTCGEGPALPFKLQCEWIERACSQVHDRVPVLVGVSSPSLEDSIGLAEHAADCGAAAIVSTLPYYFPVPEDQQSGHLVRLARRSPLPLVVYNMPACVHQSISIRTLQRLADEPNIAGFKDSAGDMDAFRQYCDLAIERRPEWCRLIGPEHLLAQAIAAGGTGGVAGGANVCPSLLHSLYLAAVEEDVVALNRLQKQADVLGRLYGQPETIGSVILGLKMALGLLGICEHHTTELFAPPTNEQWKATESVLAQLATWGLASV
ncbi:4-hydroxy-tetrahydrodipicolinate synthase [Rosistilla carotiformis]|uniref:4-hydroxy-tetrahydrodipicolinate synthase n=1 Tax=Rosistilla carotiformis TaxID=2528017 RepID=A0A518JZ40_9BACT|nr:dihydrodipicolinate synthase family protein [Rosistilla carotiformis]QDV70803.1 4-hydroxy-tetrahydrodipicolinate synthase [Rosistilla carotiformis]